MPWGRNLSIRRKLTLLMISVSGATLIAAFVALGYNDYASSRRDKRDQLVAAADLIATHVADALKENRAAVAEESLASLRRHPTVRRACLYDRSGDVFAVYVRDPQATADFPPAPA